MAVAVAAGVMLLGPAAVHAEDPPAQPVQQQEVDNYGPAINPTVTTDTPQVNPGNEIRVFGADFCASITVVATVSPQVSGFPKTLTSDSQGKVSLKFTAPATLGPYTVTLTGQPVTTAAPTVDRGCGRSGSVVVTVVDVDSGGPVPEPGGGSGSGQLPATGSSSTGLQLRNGVVAVIAGLGMVLVAARRRRSSGAITQ